MTKSVYVVSKIHGESEGSTVHAICFSREQASKAKKRLIANQIGTRRSFCIKLVVPDVLYPYGILANDTILIEGQP